MSIAEPQSSEVRSGEPFVVLENVTRTFSMGEVEVRVLRGVTASISRGRMTAIWGESGSGKTTLLNIAAGYLWPTSGEIEVLGERFGRVDLRELRKRIGWVGSFLSEHMPPAQRPGEVIASGRHASIGIFDDPTPADLDRARELAAELGCEGVFDREWGVLSQGEKQRVLIARALMNDPDLLILDEPCSGLDLVARERLLQTLERVGRPASAPTLLFVTHHLEEVMPVFGHALLLREGRVLAQGRREGVLTAENLSAAFGIPLKVTTEGGRSFVRAS